MDKGLIKTRGKARTDSTHVLAAIHQLNRIGCVAETLRHALNQLASVAPEWLCEQVSLDWFDRYSSRWERSRPGLFESFWCVLAPQPAPVF